MTNKKKKPTVQIQLSGPEGNAYVILGRASSALLDAGYTVEEKDQYIEEATADDYDHLLKTTKKWVNLV